MGKGNLLRREQINAHRQQTQWANRQAREYRANRAQMSAFEAMLRQEEMRIRLAQRDERAREELRREAALKEAEDLLAEEAARKKEAEEAERLKKQKELEEMQRTLERQQRKQAAKDAKMKALIEAEERRAAEDQARRDALRKIQDDFQTDNAALAKLKAGLPALRTAAQRLQKKLENLKQALLSTAGDDKDAVDDKLLEVQQMIARCTAAMPEVDAAYKAIKQAPISNMEGATRQAVLSLGMVPQAYDADDARIKDCGDETDVLHQQYQAAVNLIVQYPNLGLTHDLIGRADSPTSKLTLQQLSALNTKLSGCTVTSWERVCLPSTRPAVGLAGQYCYIPKQVQNFPFEPSGEIFCDWVWPYEGHGQAASSMKRYLVPISGAWTNNKGVLEAKAKAGTMDVTLTKTANNGKKVITSRNVTLNIVLNDAETVLVTYYSTA